MKQDARTRSPRIYAADEWDRLSAVKPCYMVPVTFDDLLAPCLPVDAMRLLRHLWWRKWGDVQANPILRPEAVAAFFPEWAYLSALTESAQETFPWLLARKAEESDELSAGDVRWAWSEAWASAVAQMRDGALRRYVATYQGRRRDTVIYERLLSAIATPGELAAIFGANSVSVPAKRGRGPASVHKTRRWMEQNDLISSWLTADGRAAYEFGNETWRVLTEGRLSPELRATLGARAVRSFPFFRGRNRRRRPTETRFDELPISVGRHYEAPTAMEVLLERNLPSTVMPIIWFIARHTFGRPTSEHSSVGYVELGIKKAARLYGPARVTAPTQRARRIATVRGAIDWAVSQGLIDRKRHRERTELSLGPEIWFAFQSGQLSSRMCSLLGADATRVRSPLLSSRHEAEQLLLQSMGDDAFPLAEVSRLAELIKLREDRAWSR